MDIDEEVPRGFRFYPTEEELVSFYLHNKLNHTRPEIDRVIPLVDVYDYNPSDLPLLGGEYSPVEGEEWFFFTERDQSRGGRPNRLTKWGYWKATGSPGDVYSSENRVIGRKRSMVFYIGRAPNGTKTVWKMIEYKALSAGSSTSSPQLREELCLCRIYKQSKFLRAFDRRPPSAAVTGDEAAAAQHRHRSSTGVTAFNNPADHSSFESSSSIDMSAAANLSWFVESGSNRLPEKPSDGGGEILWDCARLNWFD